MRAGTPAARMPQVPPGEIKVRAARLREKGRHVLEGWLRSQIGSTIPVALEQSSRRDTTARTPQFAVATVSGIAEGRRPGEVVSARVHGHDGRRLLAEAVA